ncbi:hypothetical protein [Hymenobacter sp. BT730]|nr:hypothetical protein [Hymenobacter sp. BT730]
MPRTTDSYLALWDVPNRLLGQHCSKPSLSGDITYLPKQGGGWLYLAT